MVKTKNELFDKIKNYYEKSDSSSDSDSDIDNIFDSDSDSSESEGEKEYIRGKINKTMSKYNQSKQSVNKEISNKNNSSSLTNILTGVGAGTILLYLLH